MDVISHSIAFFLGIFMISSAISKERASEKFFASLERYIFGKTTVARQSSMILRSLGWVIVVFEFTLGIALFAPNFQAGAILMAGITFAIFCAVIAQSLVRGFVGKDCGCGGLFGNHSVSPALLARNLIMALGAGFSYYVLAQTRAVGMATAPEATSLISLCLAVSMALFSASISVLALNNSRMHSIFETSLATSHE